MPVEVSVSCCYSFVTFLVTILFFNNWENISRNFVCKLFTLVAEEL